MIKPIGRRLLISVIEEEKSDSMIIIPESSQESLKEPIAKIEAVGTLVDEKHGLKEGQTILFDPRSLKVSEIKGVEHLVLDEAGVIAILEA